MQKREIIRFKMVATRASILGFYKIKGLASKSGKCRHVSCGATSPTTCVYFEQQQHDMMLRAKAETYGLLDAKFLDPTWDADKRYMFQWIQNSQLHATRLANLKNYHPNCLSDWCVKVHGPRPDNLGEMVKCNRMHLSPYTDEELAVPDTKPESVAVNIRVALDSRKEAEFAVALYDLMEDRWFNNDWWQQTGSGILMPHKNARHQNDVSLSWPAPSEVSNINEVLDALKRSL